MFILDIVLGSEEGEKPSWCTVWKKTARNPPAWRRTGSSQAISEAEPEFCRRGEKWVMFLNLHVPCYFLNNACFLQYCKFDCDLRKKISTTGYDYDDIPNLD